MYNSLLRNFLGGNSLELITLVLRLKIIADFPQLIIHKTVDVSLEISEPI